MKLLIKIKIDNQPTQEFYISKTSFTLGRAKKNDICIKEDGLSRKHCKFEISEDGEIFVTDLNSTNGVLIEGARISSGLAVRYLPYFSMRIGPICAFEVVHEEELPNTARSLESLFVKNENQIPLPKVEVKENAKKTRQSSTEKRQQQLGIWIFIIFLTVCILYVIFEINNENKFNLPISPSTLTF